MEHFYQLFMEVFLKEIEKCQLNTKVLTTYLNQLTSSLNQNFDVPYNRCAYMYKYSTINTYFFRDCVNHFLLDYSNAKGLLSEWKSHSEVKVCSLSVGPGLDYLAFILAILQNDPSPPNFTGTEIISKHGAWRNTVKLLLEVLQEQGSIFDIAQSKLKYESVNVIQAGQFQIASVCDAHVVLMVKVLNLKAVGDPQEGPLLQMLQVLISSLRSDVTIFCIDTKPSIALFTKVFSNFPGRFLYGPVHRTTKVTVDFPEVFGSRPAVSNRGAFFVWQKLSSNSSLYHPNPTSVSTEYESNLKVAYGSNDDIPTLSNPSPIENESEVQEDSVNRPWSELKNFWKSSSPKTKKLLKELMLSDKERVENIGDFISHSEKVDSEVNKPGNITHIKMLDGTGPSFPLQNALPTVSNLNNMADSSSTLVNAKSSDDTNKSSHNVRSLSIDTINTANTVVYENIALPGKNEIKTSILSSSEKHTNYDAPNEIDSIKIKSDSEECIFSEDIDGGISSHKKEILTDFQESQSSTSIKELTASIRRLVTSLEIMTQQNEPPDNKTCNGSPNNSLRQTFFAPNSDIHDVPSCSNYSQSCGSTERNNLPCYDSAVEKKHCLFRCQCCHNRCHLTQCACQSSCCHFKQCSSKPVPGCFFSYSTRYSEGNFEDATSPSIVIPLQNIGEDALLKLVAVLKSDSKLC